MNTKTNQFKLSISHYKIIETIHLLNNQKKYPTAKGVNNILSGKTDEETIQYTSLITYGTLLSYQGRKLCACITNLVRRGYLSYIYDKNSDGMYLRVTEKGEGSLISFHKTHKNPYVKKVSKCYKKQIVEIL